MTNPFQSFSEPEAQSTLEDAITVLCSNACIETGGQQVTAPFGGAQRPVRIETGLAELSKNIRLPLCGGTYAADHALRLLNSHYFIGKNGQETAVFRINDDRSATF